MKKLFILSLIALGICNSDKVFSQQPLNSKHISAKPRKANYTTFTLPTVVKKEEAMSANRGFENDPEVGVLYSNAPCKDCYEMISERTETSKTFTRAGSNGHDIIIRSANFPMHYRDEKGKWRTIQSDLKPTGTQGVYATSNQPVTVNINTKEHHSNIASNNGSSISYNRDLELVYITPDGTERSLGAANWTNYTAGDDGVYVKDAWPGIDIEMNLRPGGIKTSFSINHPLPAYASGKLALRDHMQFSKGLSMNVPVQKNYNGDVNIVNAAGESFFTISGAVAYERFDPKEKMMPLEYSIGAHNILDINVPGEMLNKSSAAYPLIVDPLIVTNSITGPNFSPYYPAYCTANNTLTVPNATTITDVQQSYAYAGNWPAATNLMDGGYLITVGTCQSPPAPYTDLACTGSTLLYYCNPIGVSIYSDVGTCMPVISCTSYNLTFTIGCTQDVGTTGGLCSTHYFYSMAPFEIDIIGVTSANPVAISGTPTVCVGGTTTLSDGASTGWPWFSSTPAVATVNSVTGVVSGLTPGTTTITYGYAPCAVTKVVTVNALTPITGTLTMCIGSSTTLTNATGGGAWTTTPGSGSVTVVGTGTVTGSTAGTAHITYTYPTGCITTAIVTVSASPGAINGTLAICQGSFTLLTDATAGGTWSSVTPAIGSIASSASGSTQGVSAGTTTISYIISAGCFSTAVLTVTALPAAISGTMSVCTGLNTTLTDLVTGGAWTTSPGTGSVTDPGGLVTGVTAGTANITYSIGTCIVTAIVTVNQSPTAILGVANVCVGLTTTLTDATAGGTWSSSLPSIGTINTSGVGTLGGIAGGTTVITYTMPGNCIITTVATVNPAPSAIGGTLTVCQGLTTALTNTVTGGVWACNPVGVATVNPASGVVYGVGGGTAIVTYTSSNCTPVTAIVTVNPVSPILGNLSVCSGLCTPLSDAIGGGSWGSSNVAIATIGSSSGSACGLGAGGTVTITYTFTTGCSTTAVLTVNTSPVAISGQPLIMCAGTNMTITDATGGGTWLSSTPTVAAIVAGSGATSALAAGTTTITYTLPVGSCIATAVLTVNSNPGAINGTLSMCSGLITTLTDATSGGTWTSSSTTIAPIGSSTGTVTALTNGNEIITYWLPTGCSATAILTVNASPVAISGNHILCLGVPSQLTDVSGGGTWGSSNTVVCVIGSSSGIATGNNLGTATITYTSSTGGCTATTTITVDPVPAGITGTLSGCANFITTLSDVTSGGVWTSSNTVAATIGSATGLLSALATGTTTIDYTLSTGCLSSAVFTVNPSPSAMSGTPYICQGASYGFADGPAGGVWSSSNSNASVGTSGIVGGVNPGPSVISYTLPTTCYSTYTVTITTPPSPIGGPSSVCTSQAIVLTDAISGGSWSLTNATGTATITATGIVTGETAGLVIVSYTTLACNPATYFVTVNSLPAPITGVGNLCVGSSTTLSDATPGGTWSSGNPDATVSSAGVVSGVTTGTGGTVIYYTLPTGCYASVPVIVFPSPGPIQGIDSVCPGSSVVLTDAVADGAWSSSDGTIAQSIAFTGQVNGLVPGNVTISYTLISGCYATVPFKVLTPLPATLTITQSPDTLICSDSTVTLTANVTNGGTPTFVWERFGSYIGTGAVYPYNPTHGDFITCVMTTHDICASPGIISKDVTLNVYPIVSPVVHISSLTADSSSYMGEEYTFFTDVTFGGVTPTYQWYVNSDSITGATNNTYTTRVYGNNDTVSCVVHGNSPCDTVTYVGISNTIVVEGQGYLSTGNLGVSAGWALFPNPNTGTFVLSGTLTTKANDDLMLEVTDMLGRTVYTGKTTPHNGAVNAEINLGAGIADGTYLLRINNGSGTTTFHFVVGR